MILHLNISTKPASVPSTTVRRRSWSHRAALPPNISLTRRQYQYCVHWLDGASFAQIARDFGVNRSSVCRVIRRALSNNERLGRAFTR